MSSEQIVGNGVPPIPEETPETTPVPPRRSSQGKLSRQENVQPSPSGGGDGGVGAAVVPSVSKDAIDEGLAERRRSLVPMSSMEEENLRERLHLAQLRQCHSIVFREQKYNRDTFRRLFNSKVGNFKNINETLSRPTIN